MKKINEKKYDNKNDEKNEEQKNNKKRKKKKIKIKIFISLNSLKLYSFIFFKRSFIHFNPISKESNCCRCFIGQYPQFSQISKFHSSEP